MKVRVKGNRNIVIEDINLSLSPNKAYFHIDDERWNSSCQKDFVLKYLDILPDNVNPIEETPKENVETVNTEIGIRQENSAFILDEENKVQDNHDSVMINENGKLVDNLEKSETINKDIFNGYVEKPEVVEHDVKPVAEVKTDGDKVIGVTAEVQENKVENNEVTYVAAPGTEVVEIQENIPEVETVEETTTEEVLDKEFPVVENETIENIPIEESTKEVTTDIDENSEEEFEEVEEEVTETAEDGTVKMSTRKRRRGRPRKNK